MFANAWNPSGAEVRAWAYTPNAAHPCEDWDLALLWARHEKDYLEFAADPSCPNQAYFLHIIYLVVGSAVRHGFRDVPKPVVRGFVDLAASSKSPALRMWRERSLSLLENPSEFEYTAWCGGGLASRNETEA
jgi:hypothetical protein